MTVVLLGAIPTGVAFLIVASVVLALGMLLWEIHRATGLGRTIDLIVLICRPMMLISVPVRHCSGRAESVSSRAPPTFPSAVDASCPDRFRADEFRR